MLQTIMTRAHCHRVARVLQSYLDGEADPPTATAVAEHHEACRRCGLEASTYNSIRTAIAVGNSLRQVRVDPTTVARLDDFTRALIEQGTPPNDS